MSQDNHLLSSQVYRRIRDGILSGKYAVETELKEKAIGDELGVSRTPVREALRQLELEGLVSIIPNKGAYVVGVSLEDIHDIYEIRSLLEGLCAKWAAKNITPELLTELEENICLSEFHESKQNFEQMVSLDNRFHEILYEASGSRELKKVLKDKILGIDILFFYNHALQKDFIKKWKMKTQLFSMLLKRLINKKLKLLSMKPLESNLKKLIL